MDTLTKLGILADAAKYDAACTSSGVQRTAKPGMIGNAQAAGLCHSFTPDGRCITLLKVLMSNACSYDCAYCVNRRQAHVARATFEPRELAELTVDFYRRNYIEGLFLSSGVLGTPDATTERMIECLRVLREELRFNGYVHAKVIPGTSTQLVDTLGRWADRLSVNLELPSSASLATFCPNKTAQDITRPMAQIYQTRNIEEQEVLSLRKDKRRREKQKALGETHTASTVHQNWLKVSDAQVNQHSSILSQVNTETSIPDAFALRAPTESSSRLIDPAILKRENASQAVSLIAVGNQMTVRPKSRISSSKRRFVPAGQSTQLIIGASPESDNHILQLSNSLYEHFDLKRVFFSAYMPMVEDRNLPPRETPVPLRREHRLYQADWLMRYYAFSANELATPEEPWLDLDVDPKLAWALRHIDRFPVEVMDAPFELLLRVPGIGPVGARRIVAARSAGPISFDDLARLRITLKRARHFLTCNGKRDTQSPLDAELIRERVIHDARQSSYNRTRRQAEGQLSLF